MSVKVKDSAQMCRPMAGSQIKAPNWNLSCKKWVRWESKKAFHSLKGSGG